MAKPEISIFEVGVRDGLQNEASEVSTARKLFLIRGLVAAGVRELELGSFVRPDKVPQMADTSAIYASVRKGALDLGRARAWALVPNRKGLELALAAGVRNIAVFTASTESFVQRNIGMSIAESLTEFAALIAEARRAQPAGTKIRVRGYISTAFGCPFEGKVAPRQPLKVAEKLLAMGCDQVSIGDTIGVATPGGVDAVVAPALARFGAERAAVHFHDTRGTALANALRSLELGARVFDSSAGGLGGCPFAPGATGNLATEDLVYMMHGLGVRTGIDLEALCKTSLKFSRSIGREITSRYLTAWSINGY